jgi:uncharacterized membrane protein YdbT with pleckstrin-like domain
MPRVGPKVSQYVLSSEERVFAVRRHWMALASTFLLFLGFLVIGFLLLVLFREHPVGESVAIFFLIFSVLWFLWYVLDWYFEELIVTNRRVLLISGVLNRKVGVMPLIKVTDLTFVQPFSGRFLGYGTFIIESAGQDQALSRIAFVPKPVLRYQEISRTLFGTEADVDPEDKPPSRTNRENVENPTAPLPEIRQKRPVIRSKKPEIRSKKD